MVVSNQRAKNVGLASVKNLHLIQMFRGCGHSKGRSLELPFRVIPGFSRGAKKCRNAASCSCFGIKEI